MNNKIKSLKMAGFTVPEIAKKLNVSISLVRSELIHGGASEEKETRRALNELDTIRSENCIKRMR